jgi:hypothetical protein
VALCRFLAAAFAASRRPLIVWNVPNILAYATPMRESMHAPKSEERALRLV